MNHGNKMLGTKTEIAIYPALAKFMLRTKYESCTIHSLSCVKCVAINT